MADLQHAIREEAHKLRQRFEQVENVGYDEVIKAVDKIRELAVQLPDAPPPKKPPGAVDDEAPATILPEAPRPIEPIVANENWWDFL